MKKIFTLCLLAGIATIAAAQIVPRDKVILEIGTGTWCTYCPGAAMGADDLLEQGYPVGVVENHNGVIEFDTAVGKGTTFRVHLPAKAKAEVSVG